MLDGLSKYTVADSPLVVLRESVTCELSIRRLPRSLRGIQPRGCAFRGWGGEGGEGGEGGTALAVVVVVVVAAAAVEAVVARDVVLF